MPHCSAISNYNTIKWRNFFFFFLVSTIKWRDKTHASSFIQICKGDGKQKVLIPSQIILKWRNEKREGREIACGISYNDLTSLYFSLVKLELPDLHQHFQQQSTEHHSPHSDQRAPNKAQKMTYYWIHIPGLIFFYLM